MNRVQRALATTGVILAAGVALALYAWLDDRSSAGRQLASEEEKRLFRFGRDHVKGGVLTAPKVSAAFERAGPDSWQLTKPVLWPADSEALVTAIDHLAGMRAQLEIKAGASKEELATYGLDQPRFLFRVTLEDGTEQALAIGADNPLERRAYATTDRQRIVAIDTASIWAFDRDLFALRSKRVFEVARDAVRSIEVDKAGRRAYRLERLETGWQITAKDGAPPANVERTLPADPLIVDRFLLRLTRDLKAESFPTDTLDPNDRAALAGFGLASPAFTVRITDAGGLVREASIGVVEKEGPGPFAWLAGTRSVAEIDDGVPGDLDQGLERFRDHTIARFEEDEAEQVELFLLDGRHAILERESGTGDDAKWSLKSPRVAPANAWRMRKLVLVFSNLFSDRVATDTGTTAKAAELGLAPPRLRAVFKNSAGAVLADVRIGKNIDETHVFITAKDMGRIDAIKTSKVAVIPGKLEELIESAAP